MVSTRSTVRKERENKEIEERMSQQEAPPPSLGILQKYDKKPLTGNCGTSQTGAKSKLSKSSSSLARRKQLEFEAAQQKAKIQMDLIDKKLEADLANLTDEEEIEYSPHHDLHTKQSKEVVEEWLDQSQCANNLGNQAPDDGILPGLQCLPPELHPGTDNGTVHMLANALQNLTASSTNRNDKILLSRLCTPRDLPSFSGDPLDWLQFKQAYDESTEVCGFSPKENIGRLRKCLHGPAKEAVSALMITATSPNIVMSTLELQFGNSDGIINKIIQGIRRLPPISTEYNKDIVPFSVKVQNFIAAVNAVGRVEYLQDVNIVNIILFKFPSVLISKWTDYSFPIIQTGKKPRLTILGEFLHEEAVKITTTANLHVMDSRSTSIQYHRGARADNNATRQQTLLVQSTCSYKDNKCLFCHRGAQHALPECKLFKKALRKDRWRHVKRHGVCFKCLVSRHDRETCPAPVCDKDECGEAHHRLLHYVQNRDRDRGTVQQTQSVSVPGDSSSPAETVTHINLSEHKVLLKVVPIKIHGPNGIIPTTALLDDGSTVTLISSSLAARAGLRGQPETMRVSGAWSDSDLVCTSTVISVDISNFSDNVFNIKVRSVDNLKLPEQDLYSINCNHYAHLQNLKDKLSCINTCSKPEVLIGQDNYHLLLPLEISVGKPYEPSATRCALGWCVHGNLRAPRKVNAVCAINSGPVHTSLLVAPTSAPDDDLRDLHEEVRRYFLLDSVGVSSKPRQNKEDVRALAQLDRTTTYVNGQWQVGLPWRDENCVMPDSYSNALSRLKGVERKMQANGEYARRYADRVHHLFNNNFAREVSDTRSAARTWYLPHFGVDNPNKQKLRLVFDAASRSCGSSLNDYLLQGPDLLASLFGIMVRFRENRYAVVGDIRDMFLRVKIRPEDQDALRFLWRSSPKQQVKIYAMTSLIFGANCSPFIAQYVKNKNALRFESTMPAAVHSICGQHYMDDFLDSLPDTASAIQLIKDIIYIHKQGGFEMCNWLSNSEAVLQSLPKEALGPSALKLKIDCQRDGERTLGLLWYPANDEFGFDLSLKRIPVDIVSGAKMPTKRIILKVTMSIFDVFGFLSPFTIQGKLMIQELWQLKIDWDDIIPDNIYAKWKEWMKLLTKMRYVRIPRCYINFIGASETDNRTPTCPISVENAVAGPRPARPALPSSPEESATRRPADGYESIATTLIPASATELYVNLQLHVFCDASTKAMCAVAYWRWTSNNKIFVAFIASKCRVLPVKPLTVPRSELQAAVIAVRLADCILKEHRLVAQRRFFWSDSTTVLQWINNDARNYKTFIANRLGEIDELSRSNEWRYVPTKLNVADVATRETYDETAFNNEWLKGPLFLHYDESSWPCTVIGDISDETVERINVLSDALISVPCLPIPNPDRFSSWLRLLRSTYFVLEFIRKCRKFIVTEGANEDVYSQAERLLIRQAQSESFSMEIAAIKKGKNLEQSSRLLTWSPYLDEYGVIRCRGRIGATPDVAPETKQPIILDGRHPITKLLVRHYHIKAAHGNQETVINNLKEKYAILRIRPTVKYVAMRCMFCRIRKAKVQVPMMGDLPLGRVAHHQRAFTHCGLDLFGPMEVAVGRSRAKRYGVIFTCLTVRAIHIEIVHSLTTDSLIMAIRRMAARRAWPRYFYSDNGTNLRGADTELRRSIQGIDHGTLGDEAQINGAVWKFIPPASPHWGGAWERLIRSIKKSLAVVLKERAPKDEVLSTLMTEVENIVNSRPLTHVSVEPGSPEALTPNHFLIQSASNSPILGEFDDSDLSLRKQWRKSQRLADMYWQRWVKEYLPELIPRRKWNTEHKPLQVGDLVLIVDPTSPRNVWPKAVVQQVFPGKDGRVRLVELKTKSGTLKRSAARVAKIPLEEEC